MEVHKLFFNISTYDIIQEIANISGDLALRIDKIVKKCTVEELKQIKAEKTEASGDDINYLLELMISIHFKNLSGMLIGYKN